MSARKTKVRASLPMPPACSVCTTPTRCKSSVLGQKGQRCAGRGDAPDDCDCLNECGDDPWLATGKSRPCEKRRAQTAARAQAVLEHEQLLQELQDAIALVEGDRLALVICHSLGPEHSSIPDTEPAAIASEQQYKRAIAAMRKARALLQGRPL